MKIISNARAKSMQEQIRTQASTIRYLNGEVAKLERANVMQAERIGELEGLLFGYGIVDRDGQLRSDATERAKVVSEVLERMDREASPTPATSYTGGGGAK